MIKLEFEVREMKQEKIMDRVTETQRTRSSCYPVQVQNRSPVSDRGFLEILSCMFGRRYLIHRRTLNFCFSSPHIQIQFNIWSSYWDILKLCKRHGLRL